MNADAGTIQDLFHYSLALKGEANGMDANTLAQRIQCGENAKKLLNSLESDKEIHFFDSVIPNPDSWNNEQDMIIAGEILWCKAVEWAQFHGFDARSGETNPISCRVCGKPAMPPKTTLCFKHTFGHELGDDIKGEWILTDGTTQSERRMLTEDEAESLNEKAKEATAGNWWWAKNVNPSGRAGSSQLAIGK